VREAEFRTWLQSQGYKPNTVNTQMAQARRLDQAYGDLDALYAQDKFAELTASLAYSRQDKRLERENPARFTIAGDLYANLASYRASLTYYARFASGEADSFALDIDALEALKKRFLRAYPDFEAGGGFPGSSAYHRAEDDHKRALIDVVQAEMARQPAVSDEALGAVILDGVVGNRLIPYYKTRDHLAKIRIEHPGIFEDAAGQLARSTQPAPKAAADFLDVVWSLLRKGSEQSPPYSDTRIYASVIQALARPEAAIFAPYSSFQVLGRALLGRPLFGRNELKPSEYEAVLVLAGTIFTVMDQEWGWQPRDLWDVQGFVWISCGEKLGGDEMGPAIDRDTVEKVMDECDALGDHDFVEKYGMSLKGVRYRVVRGAKRYPSKAIANAAYTVLHGEDGPYSGTRARKVLEALRYEIVEGSTEVEDERSPADIRTAATDPVNLILYGPPGTGKTYATAAHAVRLCRNLSETDPLFDDDARAKLMEEYRRLQDARRIQFVTFHQNYSYEEFVEGLRPETQTEEDDKATAAGFRLVPKRGIFREISALAEQARKTAGHKASFDMGQRQVFKMSLGRAGIEDYIFDAAIEGGYVAIGWGGQEDWSDPRYDGDKGYDAIFDRWNEIEPGTKGNSGHISQLWRFRSSMRTGDLVVVSNGNSEFRAVGEITGPYRFELSEDDYHHRRSVRWLLVPDEPLPADSIYEKPFVMRSCYLLRDAFLKRDALSDLLLGDQRKDGEPDGYVLVIDEINRANISKVFGELITLLEPDKRIGQDGELKVQLPYSRKMFGVPSNLHIVGTMNTADRSIALLDTALRRRFDFVELMPEPDRLPEKVAGVPLRAMLRTINDRIEYLFDREHQIGHGFFMACRTKADVDRVMRRKVLPLLQEYFFEDWEKVARVLGDSDVPAGQGGFITWQYLTPPAGDEDGHGRKRWLIRTEFDLEAYERFGA
jgi:5-methylcytosine-specific restriction protein B